jgi:RNA polymerase sigma-70 factor (ECF subfamily)
MADGEKYPLDVEQMYQRYAPMVLRRCRKLLRNEEDAVEAMQDVFVRLLTCKEQLHGQYPSSLLFRIATNICLNIIRDRKLQMSEAGEEMLAKIACSAGQEKKTLAEVILAHIFRCEKPSTREIAVLHFVDGMTYREVAREINLSVSGVRKRLRDFRSRALKVQEE